MLDPLQCPRCASALIQRTDQHVLDCPNCRGTFYDAATLKRIIQEVRRPANTAPYSRPPLSLSDPARYLPCPLCGELMHRRNFGKSSAVIVDICTRDGVWFDDRELGQVLDFCASGELAKSERFDRERSLARRQVKEFKREVGRAGPAPDPGSISAAAVVSMLEDMFSPFSD